MESIPALITGLLYVGLAIYMIIDPEALGQYTGRAGHGHITATTPGCMVRAAGCCMLAIIPGALVAGFSVLAGVIVGLMAAVVLYVAAARFFG